MMGIGINALGAFTLLDPTWSSSISDSRSALGGAAASAPQYAFFNTGLATQRSPPGADPLFFALAIRHFIFP